MRGSRIFGPAYVLTYDLLDGIASLDDPAKSVMQGTFEFWQATPWYDKARLTRSAQGSLAACLELTTSRGRLRAEVFSPFEARGRRVVRARGLRREEVAERAGSSTD
jgi:hypothetical protein